jgi:hypothetical protein
MKLASGQFQIDQLGTSNLIPLTIAGANGPMLNPALADHNLRVIKNTHGKTSHLSRSDLDALIKYLLSLE